MPERVIEIDAAAFTTFFSVSAAAAGPGSFAVAYTGDKAGGQYRTMFATLSLTQVTGSREILSGPQQEVVRLVKTQTGWALLLLSSEGTNKLVPYVVILDANGSPAGPARRLKGTKRAYSIAVRGSDLGVVAWKDGEELAFRPLDAAGAALGSWVCLTAKQSAPETSGAVEADGSGWAISYRAPDGAILFQRFDRLGTGNP
jgi:hypothetical protein